MASGGKKKVISLSHFSGSAFGSFSDCLFTRNYASFRRSQVFKFETNERGRGIFKYWY